MISSIYTLLSYYKCFNVWMTRIFYQVQDLQESLRSKNNVATKMKQTLVDKEKDQDNLLCQLDEKTEKIHDMNHKFLKQDNELHLLSMEIKTFEEKFVEQKQLTTQKVCV